MNRHKNAGLMVLTIITRKKFNRRLQHSTARIGLKSFTLGEYNTIGALSVATVRAIVLRTV